MRRDAYCSLFLGAMIIGQASAMCDLDDFFGHGVGDAWLASSGFIAASELEEIDVLYKKLSDNQIKDPLLEHYGYNPFSAVKRLIDTLQNPGQEAFSGRVAADFYNAAKKELQGGCLTSSKTTQFKSDAQSLLNLLRKLLPKKAPVGFVSPMVIEISAKPGAR